MEAIKLLNEAVDTRLVLQLITDRDEDFYSREYYLVSRGKEQILLLSSNEEYFGGNLEIIRTEDKFLRSFQKSPYPKSHLDILPNYADYSISGGDLFFLDFFQAFGRTRDVLLKRFLQVFNGVAERVQGPLKIAARRTEARVAFRHRGEISLLAGTEQLREKRRPGSAWTEAQASSLWHAKGNLLELATE